MPRYPGAVWEPITGGTDGPMRAYRFVVLHVNDSNGADLFNWENGGGNNMSSHFQFPKVGRPFQYLDTAVDSWCQADGNMVGISFEVEGFPTEPMNENQLNEIAACLAWVHATHGVPLQITDDPVNGQGLITHGDGGTAWGGHTGCPGPYRTAQRQDIINRAKGNPAMSLAQPLSPADAQLVADEVKKMLLKGGAVADLNTLRVQLEQWWMPRLPGPVDVNALAAAIAPDLAPLLNAAAGGAELSVTDVEGAVSRVLAGTTFKVNP